MTDVDPFDGLNHEQGIKVSEFAQRAPASLMDRLNWALHRGSTPDNQAAIKEDVNLRLRWGRALLDNIEGRL